MAAVLDDARYLRDGLQSAETHMKPQRHSWGDPSRIPNAIALPRKTERQCLRCPIVKVTWHEMDGSRETYRTEFWRGLDRIEGSATPACEVLEIEVA